jgi:hypothetical protein
MKTGQNSQEQKLFDAVEVIDGVNAAKGTGAISKAVSCPGGLDTSMISERPFAKQYAEQ